MNNRRMFPRSIRSRITLAAAASTALLLAAVSIMVVVLLRRQLTDNLDEGLANRAAIIASLVDAGSRPAGLPDDEDLLIQIVDAEGSVVAASPNLSTAAGPIAGPEPGVRTIGRIEGRAEQFRAIVAPLGQGPRAQSLIVGVNLDDVNDPVRIVSRLLWIVVPLVVAALAAMTWTLTGRTLRPVERISAEMAAITSSDLGRRVPEPPSGDEIARLAQTTNRTLDRLEQALRRQQQFVADASHELRSPLTRIRTELEIDLGHPDDADPLATQRTVLAETVAMQALVEDLLHLARADAGAIETAAAPLDLDDIVFREARRLAERGRVCVDTAAVSAAAVTGDAAQLRRAIRNLLDNAERHAAATVTLTLTEAGPMACLAIANDGAPIPADQRSAIFERFTRLDEARNRDGGGSGLGLAITRDIIQRHGGTVALSAQPPTTFVIELPSRP